MALANLADISDLSARGVDVSNATLVGTMLAVASSVVRQAAGSPISETTGTITLWATDCSQWLDLPRITTAVSSVKIDGTAVTDYTWVGARLFRVHGWGSAYAPRRVDVTLTQGYATVPDHIVQLVCDLAILGMSTATEGAHDPRVWVESIDDYRVTFNQKGDVLASAMELPPATRKSLAAMFGTSAGMVTFS